MKPTLLLLVCASGLLTGCGAATHAETAIPRYQLETAVLRRTPMGYEVAVSYKFDPVTGKTWFAESLGT
jgi:hypothetical protein